MCATKQERAAADRLWPQDRAGVQTPAYRGTANLAPSLAAVRAYVATFKMRSLFLNAFSALIGVLLAAGTGAAWGIVIPLVAAGGLVTAGCGALNSYLDRDIDGAMARTARRPLPSGRISPPEKVLYVGGVLTALGLILSAAWLNWLATLFMASGAGIYIFVYTLWLKRRTPWSVVIGGVAGSCALLAGWAAAGGGSWLPALIFGLFIFLWTPGHFWGFAVWSNEDNETANAPTLPAVQGEETASRWAAVSNLALVPFSVAPYALGLLGEAYLSIALAGGLAVLALNLRLYLAPTLVRARAVFKVSSPYLAVVYLAVVADVLLV